MRGQSWRRASGTGAPPQDTHVPAGASGVAGGGLPARARALPTNDPREKQSGRFGLEC